MRVFLTGVSGYLGRILAERLAQLPEVEHVTGIDIVAPKTTLPKNASFIQLDTRSPEVMKAMAGHQVVVHTAAVVLWRATLPKTERDDINQNGTRNVAQAAAANAVRRFIHASSVAVYDPDLVKGKQWLDEQFPIGNGSSFFYYANAKALAERAVNEALASTDTVVTILRPHFIMGPRNWATMELLRKNAIRYGGHDPRLQYVHEDDVAAAFAQAVTTAMPGAYNVAPDGALHWSNVLEIIGRKAAPRLPVWLARSAAALAWRFAGAPMHPAWISAVLADFTVSNTKLKATGWQPRYSSEEALLATLGAGQIA